MEINPIMQGNVGDISNKSGEINITKVSNAEMGITTQEKAKEYSKKELDKSLRQLDSLLEKDNAHAEYSVNEYFGTIMIKIVDDQTKEVLLETPSEKILDMIASLCKNNALFSKRA